MIHVLVVKLEGGFDQWAELMSADGYKIVDRRFADRHGDYYGFIEPDGIESLLVVKNKLPGGMLEVHVPTFSEKIRMSLFLMGAERMTLKYPRSNIDVVVGDRVVVGKWFICSRKMARVCYVPGQSKPIESMRGNLGPLWAVRFEDGSIRKWEYCAGRLSFLETIKFLRRDDSDCAGP